MIVGKKYTTIFFDLDHTLWDFETNSKATLKEIHQKTLGNSGIEFQLFYQKYFEVNDKMWADYRLGKTTKEKLRIERFSKVLEYFEIVDEVLAETFASYYVEHSPRKTALFADCIEVLTYLKSKYQLHIITNGFEEVQHLKMERSGLSRFFKHVITSEKAGALKPSKQVFDFAIQQTGANYETSLMIGDSLEADVYGAQNAGMDAVWFNPKREENLKYKTSEVEELSQLRQNL